jgi:N-methylhydantoinase A
VGIERLRAEADRLVEIATGDLVRGGFPPQDRAVECAAALRYFGQEYALEVPLEDGDDLDTLRRRFDRHYRRRYAHAMTDPVQLVHLRVRGIGRNPRPRLHTVPRRDHGGPTPREVRSAFCFARREMTDFAVYRRDELRDGDVIDGAAIVEEATTTIVMHSDQAARVDAYGHLFVGRQAP